MRIRPLEPVDRRRILEIVVAAGNFTPAEIETALEVVDEALAGDEDYAVFVLEDDGGRVAGYECHGPTPLTDGTWDLYWIAVDPACQGSGFGRALLAFAEADVRATGGRVLLIGTPSQGSYGGTIPFYEESGHPPAPPTQGFF